jgi:hypothetical protein
MKLPSKSGNLVLALLFLCVALLPYSHCSADEIPLHHGEPCGSDCEATPGFPAFHEHGFTIHQHDPNSNDARHFHFFLEGGNTASITRSAAESPKAPESSAAVVHAFPFANACYVVSRSADFSDFTLLTQFQTIPTGLSPPFLKQTRT